MTKQQIDNEEHFRKLERAYLTAPINDYYQPKIHVEHGRCEIEVTIEPKFFHAAGSIHGSVYFKSLDDAAAFSVYSMIPDVFAATVAFNINFYQPISEGKLIAQGNIVSHSGRIYTAESKLFSSENTLLASGIGTFTKTKIPLSPAIGYQ